MEDIGGRGQGGEGRQKDWLQDLQTAVIERHAYFGAHNKNCTSQWAKAKTSLLKSNSKIVVTKSGPNKGNVRGIPKEIDGNVQQVLIRIVKGEEDVHVADYDPDFHRDIREHKFFKSVKRADSKYAILAAVYSMTANADQYIPKFKIINKGKKFTDLPMDSKYRPGMNYQQRGAWMAMKGMVDQGIFVKTKGGGGPYGGNDCYRLTGDGRKLCYSLFNPKDGKFKDEGILSRCRIDEHGNCIQGGNFGGGRFHNTNFEEFHVGQFDDDSDERGGVFPDDYPHPMGGFGLHSSGARTPLAASSSTASRPIMNMGPRSEGALTLEEIRERRLAYHGQPQQSEEEKIHLAIEESKKSAPVSSSSSASSSECKKFDTKVQSYIDLGLNEEEAATLAFSDISSEYEPKFRGFDINNEYIDRNDNDNADDDDDDDDFNRALRLSLEQEHISSPCRKKRNMNTCAPTISVSSSSFKGTSPPPATAAVISLLDDFQDLNEQATSFYDFTNDDDVIVVSSNSSSSSSSSRKNGSQELRSERKADSNADVINNIIIAIDTRERVENDHYRSLFTQFQRNIGKRLSGISVDQCRLVLGDVGFLLNAVGDGYTHNDEACDGNGSSLSHCIVERKTTQDIIGQSAKDSVLAHHVNQERRMRFCELRRPVFLIEGLSGFSNRPMTHKDTDLLRADVVNDYNGIMSYLVSVICRNVGNCRVYIMQTFSEAMTTVFTAALGRVVQGSPTLFVDAPKVEDFKRRCNTWGHYHSNTKPEGTGRVAEMRSEMLKLPVNDGNEKETYHRVYRRFGDLHSLNLVYSLCKSEVHQQLLLKDLSMGGTRKERITWNVHDNEDGDDDVALVLQGNLCSFINKHSIQASTQVWSLCHRSPIDQVKIQEWDKKSGYTKRKLMILVNFSMSALFNHFENTEDFPDFINTDVLEEHSNFSQYSYARMTCQDKYGDILKKSMPLHLFLVPGMNLLEHLVVNVAKMMHQGIDIGENQLKLAKNSLKDLEKEIGILISEYDDQNKGQIVIIFEKLFVDDNPTHGAVGALRKRYDEAKQEGKSYLVLKDLREDKKRRRPLMTQEDDEIECENQHFREGYNVPLSAIKAIAADINYYVYIVVSLIICESGGQVVFSRNWEDSMKFVSEAMREMERQALLVN